MHLPRLLGQQRRPQQTGEIEPELRPHPLVPSHPTNALEEFPRLLVIADYTDDVVDETEIFSGETERSSELLILDEDVILVNIHQDITQIFLGFKESVGGSYHVAVYAGLGENIKVGQG